MVSQYYKETNNERNVGSRKAKKLIIGHIDLNCIYTMKKKINYKLNLRLICNTPPSVLHPWILASNEQQNK